MQFLNIGHKIVMLDQVGSTNNYAKDLIKNNKAENGMIVCGMYQTQGRGFNDNQWLSEQGKNLTFSIILLLKNFFIKDPFYISKAVSLGLCDFVFTFTKEVSIKWPNDIYVKNRKIAGILIENTLSGSTVKNSIIGIGVNVNQTTFPDTLNNPVSLTQLTNTSYNLEGLLYNLLGMIEIRIHELFSDELEYIDDEYTKHLYKYKQRQLFKAQGGRFEGIIKGVDTYGRLIVLTPEGEKRTFGFKEIEMVQ